MIKCKNMKMLKMMKCEMMKMYFFTLRMWHVIFGLRIGSRGTPWNSKSAGPGGSDFTKCQKWSFIWHFGVFGVFDIFHYFWCFAFSVFDIFDDFDFLHFVTFWVFHFFLFLMSCDFWSFFVIFHHWHHFWSIIVSKLGASMMTHFSPSISALPLSPILVVKLWPVFEC